MRLFRQAAVSLVATSMFLLSSARVQAQSPADKSAAEALFIEARKLLEAGNYAEACPKLADSQRLDPGVGTVLNLARCYEKLGQTASAWSTYREAASSARAAAQVDREKIARKAALALEPKLAKLNVAVADSATAPRIEVKRDNGAVPPSMWGLEVPVDPGDHLIEATAPGKKPWSLHVTAEASKVSRVTVPRLEPELVSVAPIAQPSALTTNSAPLANGPVESPPADDTGSSKLPGQRMGAIALAGAGVVALGVGTIFVFRAKSTYNSAAQFCNADNFCTVDGLNLRSQAFDQARVATITVIGGGAALVASAVLWFTAPRSSDATKGGVSGVAFYADPAHGDGAVSLSGRW